jgi:hypothetical protein
MEQKTRATSEQQSRKERGQWNKFRGKEEQERSRKTMGREDNLKERLKVVL